MRVFRVTFFCYRAMFERVRLSLFHENEKTMTQPLLPYCCGNNRGKSFCLGRVAHAKTHIQGNLSHIMNCKKEPSLRKRGVFRVTFLATELRVIGYFLRFLANKFGNAVATIGKFHLLESPEGLITTRLYPCQGRFI